MEAFEGLRDTTAKLDVLLAWAQNAVLTEPDAAVEMILPSVSQAVARLASDVSVATLDLETSLAAQADAIRGLVASVQAVATDVQSLGAAAAQEEVKYWPRYTKTHPAAEPAARKNPTALPTPTRTCPPRGATVAYFKQLGTPLSLSGRHQPGPDLASPTGQQPGSPAPSSPLSLDPRHPGSAGKPCALAAGAGSLQPGAFAGGEQSAPASPLSVPANSNPGSPSL
ncbi:hypothetical protein DIPPA_53863, partial [Diplonema papillatum]